MDEFHPQHRRMDNENIMSCRHNDLLHDLSIDQVYTKILEAQTLLDVCEIVNYTEGENTYDGYSDSRFFKVRPNSVQRVLLVL